MPRYERIWRTLPSEVIDNRSLTSSKTGMPTSRVAKRIIPQIHGDGARSKLWRGDFDERLVAEELRTHEQTLVRLGPWLKSLVQARARALKERSPVADVIDQVLPQAWELALQEEPPSDPEQRIARAADFLVITASIEFTNGVRVVLADKDQCSEIQGTIEAYWDEAEQRAAAPLRRGQELILQEQIAHICSGIAPPRAGTTGTDVSEDLRFLMDDEAVDRLYGAEILHLSTDAPAAPDIRERPGTATNKKRDSIEEPFPLGRSLEWRIGRIGAVGRGRSEWPPPYSPRESLESLSMSSARPLGLAHRSSRAIILIAYWAYSTCGKERDEDMAEGAIRLLSFIWRKIPLVFMHVVKNREFGGTYSALGDYLVSPQAYLMGRLWQRLAHAELMGHELSSADEVWQLLVSTLKSVGKNASRQSNVVGRMQSEMAGASATPKKPAYSSDPVAESVVEILGDRSKSLAERIVDMQGTIGDAWEDFLADVLRQDPATERGLSEQWEGWKQRCADGEIEKTGDASFDRIVLDDHLSTFPGYSEVAEYIRDLRSRGPQVKSDAAGEEESDA